jgi:hypothetical protein
MERPSWAPLDVDMDRPSAARVYDYFLGGAHNFAIDRQLAEAVAAATPSAAETMRANRHFLRRGVRYLIAEGIEQFIDIGSGIPTVGNVHEVAQQANPCARVVYVDMDPVAVAHSRFILADVSGTAAIQADARDATAILNAPEVKDLIDFSQPLGMLFAGITHFIADVDQPVEVVRRAVEPVASGSYLLISHTTWEGQPPEVLEAARLASRTSTDLVMRSRAEIEAQFLGWPLVEPGLVNLTLWRPDDTATAEHPERCYALGGVARKP